MTFKCKIKIETTSRVGFDKYTDDEYLDIYGTNVDEIQKHINDIRRARSSVTGDFGLTLSSTTIKIISLQKVDTEVIIEELKISTIDLS